MFAWHEIVGGPWSTIAPHPAVACAASSLAQGTCPHAQPPAHPLRQASQQQLAVRRRRTLAGARCATAFPALIAGEASTGELVQVNQNGHHTPKMALGHRVVAGVQASVGAHWVKARCG